MMTIRHRTTIVVNMALLVSLPLLVYAGPSKSTQRHSAILAMYAQYRQNFPEVSDMAAAEAKRLYSEGELQFIDVREPEEIQTATLPGAIDKETFLRDKTAFSTKTLVAFCTIGYRSGVFAQEMAQAGIPVTNLAGGILAWVSESGKVYDQHGETRRLHVYGPKWDLAPAEFITRQFDLFKRLAP
jgi:sodium/bile acid cotransporter 7